jgi:heme-degrading monooxygenase HmoA
MIKHVVTWKLKAQAEGATKAENAARMKTLLEACKEIPGIRSLEVGIDAGLDPTPWDVVLVVAFESRAALDAYQDHPVHQVAKFFIAKVREQRSVVDFEG